MVERPCYSFSIIFFMAAGHRVVTNFDEFVPHGNISCFSTAPSPVMTAYPLPLIVHHRSVFSALMPVAVVVGQLVGASGDPGDNLGLAYSIFVSHPAFDVLRLTGLR